MSLSGGRKHQFKLKYTDADPSESIILAFDSKWQTLLHQGTINAIFRRQVPISFVPDQIFAYVSKPISAITAKLFVTAFERLPVDDTIRFAKGGHLREDELRSYAGDREELVVIQISGTKVAVRPIEFAHLAKEYDFWPSSTSMPLSATGVRTLDELGFEETV